MGPNLLVGVFTVRRHLFRISSSIDAAWLTKRRDIRIESHAVVHNGKKENAMTNQVRQAETSGMVKAVSVADYIVERLAAEGILTALALPAITCFRSAMRSTAVRR